MKSNFFSAVAIFFSIIGSFSVERYIQKIKLKEDNSILSKNVLYELEQNYFSLLTTRAELKSVVDVTDSITVEDAKVVRFPTFISPIDNRAQGGGYQKFDLDNPDTVKELCRQASRELNAWIKRHEGICTLKNIDIDTLSEVADSLESESVSSEAS